MRNMNIHKTGLYEQTAQQFTTDEEQRAFFTGARSAQPEETDYAMENPYPVDDLSHHAWLTGYNFAMLYWWSRYDAFRS